MNLAYLSGLFLRRILKTHQCTKIVIFLQLYENLKPLIGTANCVAVTLKTQIQICSALWDHLLRAETYVFVKTWKFGNQITFFSEISLWERWLRCGSKNILLHNLFYAELVKRTLTATEEKNLTSIPVFFFENKIPDNIYPRILETCAELGAKN